MVVFGADWCHDSTGLAKVLTGPAFREEFGARFSVTFIDVGVPQVGKGRNLDLIARYGVKRMRGTPALFVIGPDGRPRNSRRDAQSRLRPMVRLARPPAGATVSRWKDQEWS